jgi:APA family basic amino acid/polyamine antiporter
MEKKQGQLIQTITLSSAIMLVVSSVIGSGVYKKVAPMSELLQSPSLVLWCWIAGGIISLFGALSNAEIAGMMAGSGGEYRYFKYIYGRFLAFMYGWTTFAIIKTASISSIAYVFAQSFNSILPLPHFLPPSVESLEFSVFKPFENSSVKLLTIALIMGLTWLNTRGLKGGEFISKNITKLVIAGLATIVLSCLLFGGGSFANMTTPATTYTPLSTGAFLSVFFAASLSAFWAYEGWNTIGFIGGEIKDPNKNLPRTLFFGMLIIIGAYVLVNFTYLYTMPIDKIIEIKRAQNQIAAVEVIRSFAGMTGATILSLLILFTTFGCTNATILMPPRIYQVMGEDGLFFKGSETINPETNTPNRAIWIQGIWACILVLSGSFDQLTDMLIFAAFFFYGATTLGVFILRQREPNTPRPYKVWGYPIIPALFLLFCIGLIFNTFYSHPREAGIGVVLMLTGVPLYFYWNRKSHY